jgi:hypothetical protein
MSRQDNCELRRYNRLSISNSNLANALQAEPICCECLPCPEIVQWLCPIGNEACVTPRAAAYSQFIRSYSQLFRTSTHSTAPAITKAKTPATKVFRDSITRLQHPLSTLHEVRYRPLCKTCFRLVVSLYREGVEPSGLQRKVSAFTSSFPRLSLARCHFPLHPQQGSHVPYRSLC